MSVNNNVFYQIPQDQGQFIKNEEDPQSLKQTSKIDEDLLTSAKPIPKEEIAWQNLSWKKLTKRDESIAFDSNQLSKDIWNLIFQYVEDRSAIEKVCKEFRILSYQLNATHPSISLEYRQRITKTNVKTYFEICHKTLGMSGIGQDDSILFTLNQTHCIQSVHSTDKTQNPKYIVANCRGKNLQLREIKCEKELEEQKLRIAEYHSEERYQYHLSETKFDKKTLIIIKDLFTTLESLEDVKKLTEIPINAFLANYSWEKAETEVNAAIQKIILKL